LSEGGRCGRSATQDQVRADGVRSRGVRGVDRAVRAGARAGESESHVSRLAEGPAPGGGGEGKAQDLKAPGEVGLNRGSGGVEKGGVSGAGNAARASASGPVGTGVEIRGARIRPCGSGTLGRGCRKPGDNGKRSNGNVNGSAKF